ncbi:tape measure protein [Pseudomonas aeruginosa]|uniref:tape measure protein n=1 Tax=Pseudomonas aeruginosa TaxID=287 RepID=UPI003D7BB331|nr:tape measure protein [Pseudomonas aeruginosa]
MRRAPRRPWSSSARLWRRAFLRGEEFNSVSEQAPALLKAIADGLNVNIGELRKMAAEGQLTADVLVDALSNAAAGVERSIRHQHQDRFDGCPGAGKCVHSPGR